MRKLLILLLAAGLFTACKDNKAPKEKNNRDKDDYRSGEKTDKETGDKTSTDYTEDKEKTGPGDESSGDATEKMDNTVAQGWPQSERRAFIKSCEREATAAGRSTLVAASYCQCMLDKMESAYPDIKKAAKLTMEEVQQFGAKYREACLEEH